MFHDQMFHHVLYSHYNHYYLQLSKMDECCMDLQMMYNYCLQNKWIKRLLLKKLLWLWPANVVTHVFIVRLVSNVKNKMHTIWKYWDNSAWTNQCCWRLATKWQQSCSANIEHVTSLYVQTNCHSAKYHLIASIVDLQLAEIFLFNNFNLPYTSSDFPEITF